MIFTKEKVLVCDDQPMLRALLAGAITDHSPNFEIVEVENGAEAQEALSNDTFVAVFLDVEMPVQDGFTTLKNIREKNISPDTKVVLCTGCTEESDLVRGWQLNASFYLTKPFDFDDLTEVLDAIRLETANTELAAL